jgi:hypothetical protein
MNIVITIIILIIIIIMTNSQYTWPKSMKKHKSLSFSPATHLAVIFVCGREIVDRDVNNHTH